MVWDALAGGGVLEKKRMLQEKVSRDGEGAHSWARVG
jgi:hypothetical protein